MQHDVTASVASGSRFFRRAGLAFGTMKRFAPYPVKLALKKIWFYGRDRYCSFCRSHVRFFASVGVIPRPNAVCPVCGSFERHRLVWLFFKKHTNLFDQTPKSMLHIAPEPQIERKFKKIPNLRYLTADLFNPAAMVKMDITDIQYPDNSFDVIYCSHVLEHVPDDRVAIGELYRVLKSDGWAVLLVPITVEKTLEDPSVSDPAERERLFGQKDHFRRYGPDFRHRLEEAGFHVQCTPALDLVDREQIESMGVIACEEVFLCKKRGQA